MCENSIKKVFFLRVIKIGILILSLWGIYRILDFVVTDDTYSMTRITFHEFYKMEKIDSIYVGASHTFKGINAKQLSENLNQEVFTLSTSSQNVSGSYYILKEATEQYDLENIYLEISPAVMKNERKEGTTRVYIISDYLENPWIKIQYLINVLEEDQLPNAFLTVKRNLNIMNFDSSVWNIPLKKDENYRTYQWIGDGYQYLGRGSWTDDQKLSENLLTAWDDAGFDNVGVSEIGQEQIDYLQKIIALCKEKDIRLTLYVMPYSEVWLYHNKNYMEFTKFFEDLAMENNLGWFDLNCVKSEYLLLTNDDFMDYDHLNFNGNKKTTEFLSEYYSNLDQDYFWDSLEQKKAEEQTVPHIIALEYCMRCRSADGEELEKLEQEGDYLEYEISVIESGIGDLEYLVYYCYGEDENKSIKGENILYAYGEGNSIRFVVPYELRNTAFAIEIFDRVTGEKLYRVVKER